MDLWNKRVGFHNTANAQINTFHAKVVILMQRGCGSALRIQITVFFCPTVLEAAAVGIAVAVSRAGGDGGNGGVGAQAASAWNVPSKVEVGVGAASIWVRDLHEDAQKEQTIHDIFIAEQYTAPNVKCHNMPPTLEIITCNFQKKV